ncbi:hypothetical protein [Flavobacterium sp.]|uniref:hypothetical protein n=1 Tax=Flavobacterium sp. TaxID=239 RepID=UPI00286CF8C0|nr:hypothetical protein [Flavobacterium sp.]
MHKNLLSVLLLLFLTSRGFSQALPLKTDKPNDSLKKAAVFKKIELPADQKVSPEIFYIINDKPVSREEYLKQNKKKQ